ncbi:MAG TPA: NUDIX domain-containing protein [archaeon]|nr:NUDIX domain-containing protein [archaeon]
MIDRVAHVFVFNSKGELFLQKRTMTKDVFPGYYAPSGSGHLNLEESPKKAALRELNEEIGIQATTEQIIEIGSFKCFTKEMKELIYVFMLITNQEPKINPEEVSEAKYYSIREIKKMNKKLFIPALKKELQLYLKKMLRNLPKQVC